jgi:hypothetical protein
MSFARHVRVQCLAQARKGDVRLVDVPVCTTDRCIQSSLATATCHAATRSSCIHSFGLPDESHDTRNMQHSFITRTVLALLLVRAIAAKGGRQAGGQKQGFGPGSPFGLLSMGCGQGPGWCLSSQ